MVSILILNYNAAEDTRQCIESIYKHCQSVPFEIIVVDNASPEQDIHTLPKLLSDNHNLRWIFLQENRGYGAGNNVAMRAASFPYLLILNPDVRLRSDELLPLVNFFNFQVDAGVLGALLTNEDGIYQRSFGTFQETFLQIILDAFGSSVLNRCSFQRSRDEALRTRQPIETDWVLGAFFCVRKNVFEQLGGFDEHYFLYYEENDWCRRIKKAGWKVFVLPEMEAIHYGSKTTQRNFEFYYRVLYESKLFYIRQHYSPVMQLMMKTVSFSGVLLRLCLSILSKRSDTNSEKIKGFIYALRIHFSSVT
jgi:GT2 family glycosyltransferase